MIRYDDEPELGTADQDATAGPAPATGRARSAPGPQQVPISWAAVPEMGEE